MEQLIHWEYAELSKQAKLAGGPAQLVEIIWQEGFSKGQLSGFGKGVLAFGAASLVGYGAYKLFRAIKKLYFTEFQAEIAEQNLVRGIREYDEQCNFGGAGKQQVGFVLR